MNVVSRHGLCGKASHLLGEAAWVCSGRNTDNRNQETRALVPVMPLVDFMTSGKIFPPLLRSGFSPVTWEG